MVGLSTGRRILKRTTKARRETLMKTRAARERVVDTFDVGGTAEILK